MGQLKERRALGKRTGGVWSRGEDFFDPSTADEEDIRASIEAALARQHSQKSENKEANSESPLKTPAGTHAKSSSTTPSKRTPGDKSPISSPSKQPPFLNVSQQTTTGANANLVSTGRSVVSPISSDLPPPVSKTECGMLPTSVTLNYEESKENSKSPSLTPRKVAILKQNLLKKPDSSDSTIDVPGASGSSGGGTVSRKLRLGIDAGVASSTANDRLEKSPTSKDSSHMPPEISDVVSSAGTSGVSSSVSTSNVTSINKAASVPS